MNAAFPETVIAANTILVHSRLIQYRLGNPAAQFDVTIMMFRGICGFLACRMVSCKDFHRAIAPRTNAYPFGLGRDTNCRSALRPWHCSSFSCCSHTAISISLPRLQAPVRFGPTRLWFPRPRLPHTPWSCEEMLAEKALLRSSK
jgi:hypothetical protein